MFDPSKRKYPANVLNLWQGFAVTEKPGSWSLLKAHIRDILCNGNDDHCKWLLDWMANLFQNPARQGEVAIAMRGPEGSGKGIVARAIRHILGQHGFVISNPKHLIGNFNAHQRDCLFLFVDEAFWAGDRAHIGVLKSVITEPHLTIEGKGRDVILVPNFLHIMMATNELWAVPASVDSRRFCVFDVSNARANDTAYFGAILKELDNGGYEAMLFELLNRTITSNLRLPPVTDALVTQRTLSLPTTESWWLDCLHRGYVFASKHGLEDIFAQWINPISTELLFASYLAFCGTHHERRPLDRVHFGRWLQKTARLKPTRPKRMVIVGEHMTDTKPRGNRMVASEKTQYQARSYKTGFPRSRPRRLRRGHAARHRLAGTPGRRGTRCRGTRCNSLNAGAPRAAADGPPLRVTQGYSEQPGVTLRSKNGGRLRVAQGAQGEQGKNTRIAPRNAQRERARAPPFDARTVGSLSLPYLI